MANPIERTKEYQDFLLWQEQRNKNGVDIDALAQGALKLADKEDDPKGEILEKSNLDIALTLSIPAPEDEGFIGFMNDLSDIQTVSASVQDGEFSLETFRLMYNFIYGCVDMPEPQKSKSLRKLNMYGLNEVALNIATLFGEQKKS